MDELTKAIRHFITRGLILILAGGCVILSVMYYFDKLDVAALPTPLLLFEVGLAYKVTETGVTK